MKNKIEKLKKKRKALREIFNTSLEENNRLRGKLEQTQKIQDDKVEKLKEKINRIFWNFREGYTPLDTLHIQTEWEILLKEIGKIFGDGK